MSQDAAPAVCPRCRGDFCCGATGSAPCACTALTLGARLQALLRQRYQGCLCLRCLRELTADEQAERPVT